MGFPGATKDPLEVRMTPQSPKVIMGKAALSLGPLQAGTKPSTPQTPDTAQERV